MPAYAPDCAEKYIKINTCMVDKKMRALDSFLMLSALLSWRNSDRSADTFSINRRGPEISLKKRLIEYADVCCVPGNVAHKHESTSMEISATSVFVSLIYDQANAKKVMSTVMRAARSKGVMDESSKALYVIVKKIESNATNPKTTFKYFSRSMAYFEDFCNNIVRSFVVK